MKFILLLLAGTLLTACSIPETSTGVRIESHTIDHSKTSEGIHCLLTVTYPELVGHSDTVAGASINGTLLDAFVTRSLIDLDTCPEKMKEYIIHNAVFTHRTSVNYKLIHLTETELKIIKSPSYTIYKATKSGKEEEWVFNLRTGTRAGIGLE